MTGKAPDNEYFTSRDNAWYRMGDRKNRMIITGVLFFEDPVSYDDLKSQLESRLLPFKRFRQRAITPWHRLRPKWVLDDKFDLDRHLTHVALPEPQGKKEFQEFVGGVMDKDLDGSRALWHGWLVEGAGEGNALVVRIHHALGDGFALMYVLLGLADDPASIKMPIGNPPSPPDEIREEIEWKDEEEDKIEEEDDEDGEMDETLYGSEGVEEEDEAEEEDEDEGSSSLLGKLSLGLNAAKIGYNSLTFDKDPKTSLRGELSLPEKVSWTRTYDCDSVKAVGEVYGGTINDVLISATAGAFRRYLLENGEEVPDELDIRVAVPVNLKPLDDRDEQLGNNFGLGFVELPVGVEDPQERMEMIQERTGKLKQGTEAYLMYLSLTIIGIFPKFVQRLVMRRFRNRITAAVTNVPGPEESFEFAGSRVSDIVFWVPRTEDVGIGISIFSYDGGVGVGVAGDGNLLPEPDRLAEAFEREMEAILETVETVEPEATEVSEEEKEEAQAADVDVDANDD